MKPRFRVTQRREDGTFVFTTTYKYYAFALFSAWVHAGRGFRGERFVTELSEEL